MSHRQVIYKLFECILNIPSELTIPRNLQKCSLLLFIKYLFLNRSNLDKHQVFDQSEMHSNSPQFFICVTFLLRVLLV